MACFFGPRYRWAPPTVMETLHALRKRRMYSHVGRRPCVHVHFFDRVGEKGDDWSVVCRGLLGAHTTPRLKPTANCLFFPTTPLPLVRLASTREKLHWNILRRPPATTRQCVHVCARTTCSKSPQHRVASVVSWCWSAPPTHRADSLVLAAHRVYYQSIPRLQPSDRPALSVFAGWIGQDSVRAVLKASNTAEHTKPDSSPNSSESPQTFQVANGWAGVFRSLTILWIGAVGYSDWLRAASTRPAIQRRVREGRTSTARLAPPDVKETHCISHKRRASALLCSWQ